MSNHECNECASEIEEFNTTRECEMCEMEGCGNCMTDGYGSNEDETVCDDCRDEYINCSGGCERHFKQDSYEHQHMICDEDGENWYCEDCGMDNEHAN
jgi:hypothetical protein